MVAPFNPNAVLSGNVAALRQGNDHRVESLATQFEALLAADNDALSASSSTSSALPLLQLRDYGPDVGLLQTALNLLRFDAGVVDSDFGGRTDRAVRDFQSFANLGVDGKVGPNTWLALYRGLVDEHKLLIQFGEGNGERAQELMAVMDAMRSRLPDPSGGDNGGVHSSLPLLATGSVGNAVRLLQESLNILGFDSGTVDSAFGSMTDSAVRRFQSANSLTRDGLVGLQSWSTLKQNLRNALNSADPGKSIELRELIDQIENGANDSPSDPVPEPRGLSTLRIGSRGSAVELLQNVLNALRFDSGVVDGAFGQLTDSAVRRFQSGAGLTVDGLVGRQTWTALRDDMIDLRNQAIRENKPPEVIDQYTTLLNDIRSALAGELGLGAMDPGEILSSPNINPEFASVISSVLHELAAQGYKPKVVSGFRSFEEQNYLYSLGRTRSGSIVTNAEAGESWHNYGLAVDIALQGADAYPNNSPFWDAMGAIAHRYADNGVALVWGGDWNSPDRPHLEIHPGRTASQAATMIDTYHDGGLNAVWDALGLDSIDVPIDPRRAAADRILASIEAASNPISGFRLLQTELVGVSDAVKNLVFGDARVQQLIDDAGTVVRRAIDNEVRQVVEEGNGVFDPEHLVTLSSDRIAHAGLSKLDEMIVDAGDADAAAKLLDEVYPDLSLRAENIKDARLNSHISGANGYDIEMLKLLEGLYSVVRNADEGVAAVNQLASLASDMWVKGAYSKVIDASQEDGAGRIRNEFAMEIESYRRANGIDFPRVAAEAAIDSMQYYANSTLTDAERAYFDHAGELQFMVSQFSAVMSPTQLDSAITEYLDRVGPEWAVKEEQLREDLTRAGESFLLQADVLWQRNLPEDLQLRIDQIIENPAVQSAIVTALDSEPSITERLNIESVLGALSKVKFLSSGYALGNKVAIAYLHHSLNDSFLYLKDVRSAANVERVIKNLDELSANAGLLSKVLTRTNNIAEFREGLEILRDAIENGDRLSLDDLAKRTESDFDRMAAFNRSKPLGIIFRGYGLAASAIGAGASLVEAKNNPTLESGANALVGSVSALSGSADLVNSLAGGSERFFEKAWFSKALGSASVALTLLSVGRDLRNGDLANVGFGFAGATGTTMALLASPTSKMGPIGASISFAAAVGQVGYNQWMAAKNSNMFTGDAAIRFLDHSDLSSEAASSLVDRSSKGFSPVVAFLMYGDQQGWDQEQTIEWINSLSPDRRNEIRDKYHHALDDVLGDVRQLTHLVLP